MNRVYDISTKSNIVEMIEKYQNLNTASCVKYV